MYGASLFAELTTLNFAYKQHGSSYSSASQCLVLNLILPPKGTEPSFRRVLSYSSHGSWRRDDSARFRYISRLVCCADVTQTHKCVCTFKLKLYPKHDPIFFLCVDDDSEEYVNEEDYPDTPSSSESGTEDLPGENPQASVSISDHSVT